MPARLKKARLKLTPPVRFWRTGAVAVVMAALGGARIANAQPMQTWLSRYDVAQTAERIEASARAQGLGVFARVDGADALVLVLESARGGTPVLMQGEGESLRSELPLRLELRERAGGASEVRFPVAATPTSELPTEVMDDLAGLPLLVAEALA